MPRVALIVGLFVLFARPAAGQVSEGDPASCTAFPYAAPIHESRADAYDLRHADLSLDVFEDGRFQGRAALELSFANDADTILLGRNSAIVDSAFFGAAPIEIDTTANGVLSLALPDTIEGGVRTGLVLYFRAPPTAGSEELTLAIDPLSTWFPATPDVHDRLTADIHLSVPLGWSAAASGVPTGVQSSEEGRSTFQFSIPHELPARRIGVAAGVVDTGTIFGNIPGGRRTALTWWMRRDRTTDRPRAPEGAISAIADRMDFLSEWTGLSYPFERYAQIHVDGRASSASGVVAVPPYVEPDDRDETPYAPPSELTRPLLQQWFGTVTSVDSWRHAWMEEAFPAYLDVLAMDTGEPDAEALEALRATYMENASSPRPLVWNRWNHPSELLDAQTTTRGTWVLHMLRRSVGAEAFQAAVRHFLAENAYGRVTTADWIEAVSEATEKDVMGFADTWIYGGGHPVLDVRYSSGDNSLRLRVEQVQSGESVPDVFPLDLTVEIGMLDGAERFDVRMNDAVRTYDLSISGRPRYVAIDPDGDWLIEHNTDQSSSAWVAQLRYATAPHARRVAADNLGGAEAGNTLLLGLRAALDAESNAGVRAAIVEAIGRLPSGSASERVLIDTYGDPSPIVRRAVLRALADTMSSAAAARLALRAAETDVHYDLQAEAVRTYARIGPDNAIDVARSALVTPSHDDVIRAAGLDALGELRDRVPDVAREEGLRYASEGYPLRLRLAAVRLLGSLAPSSDVAVDRLADLLADRDPAVASSAVAALESAGFQERVFEHIDDIRAPSVQSYVRTSQACN